MKQDIAKKWAAALRSGNYKQGQLALKDEYDRFCCLGVLCDISGLTEWIKKEGEISYYFNDARSLPNEVKEWAGMKSNNGYMYISGLSLAFINDNGRSFEEIAEVIEKNWKYI